MSTWRHRHIFWRCRVSLVKLSYWSKFHVNIMTGSGVMTIFVYKRLTRNTEIGNTPFWVLPNIWRLGRARDTKFGKNVSNKLLLNATKCQGYSFYRFWVIKGKQRGKTTPPPTQIRVKKAKFFKIYSSVCKIMIPPGFHLIKKELGLTSLCCPNQKDRKFIIYLHDMNHYSAFLTSGTFQRCYT